MEENVIIIRSNITPTVNRLEQLVKEREEKEKAEREARFAREKAEREAKEAAWKKEHPILDKYTYLSYYNYETYTWQGEYVNVYFYEWSDIHREPLRFLYSLEMYKFFDRCKLNLTDADNNKIKANRGCYITCAPGTCDLIIGKDYDDLQNQYNTIKVLESVHVVNNLPAVIC